jgi:hypothetical protein
MDMQHRHGHEALTWTCSIELDIDPASAWKCSILTKISLKEFTVCQSSLSTPQNFIATCQTAPLNCKTARPIALLHYMYSGNSKPAAVSRDTVPVMYSLVQQVPTPLTLLKNNNNREYNGI